MPQLLCEAANDGEDKEHPSLLREEHEQRCGSGYTLAECRFKSRECVTDFIDVRPRQLQALYLHCTLQSTLSIVAKEVDSFYYSMLHNR